MKGLEPVAALLRTSPYMDMGLARMFLKPPLIAPVQAGKL